MQRKMLDTAIEFAVQEDVVLSDWPQFRDYLAKNGCLTAAALEGEEAFVFRSYLKHMGAKNAKKQESFRHPDTPPKSPENEPKAPICNPTTGQPLDPVERPPFSPTLDESVSLLSILQFITYTNNTTANQTIGKLIDIRQTPEHVGWDWLGLLYTR